MIQTKRKNALIIGCIVGGIALVSALLLLLFLPEKRPDPHALLAKTDVLSEQNLCLMAILEEEPTNEEALRSLLINYQKLGADPLTIHATMQAYGAQIELPTAEVQPESAGKIISRGGIATIKNDTSAYAVAQGADTTYYATDEGIYADYHGLQVQISGIKAEALHAAEGGIYFINRAQKAVEYLARDGHKIQRVSTIKARTFTFFNEKIWIVDEEGTLYCGDKTIKTPAPIHSLAATQDTLYAAGLSQEGNAAGILTISAEGQCETLLSSPAHGLFGGADGCLYYLNEQSCPMRYDPKTKEAAILAQKRAKAVTYEQGTVYYMNEKGKIKKIA